MVKKCCVRACPSESYGGCNISFHSFPNNEELRQKWLSSIHISQNITKNSVVCSLHFNQSSFYTGNSRKLLKTGAIPTISPVPKNQSTKVASELNVHRHATSPETSETSSSNIEKPPRKKFCLNVKNVGIQTESSKCTSSTEELKRKVKLLSQKLNRRDNRLKNVQSLLLLLKKKCKNFEEVEQNIKK